MGATITRTNDHLQKRRFLRDRNDDSRSLRKSAKYYDRNMRRGFLSDPTEVSFGRQAPYASRLMKGVPQNVSSLIDTNQAGQSRTVSNAAKRMLFRPSHTLGAPIQMGRPQIGEPTFGGPVQMGRPQQVTQGEIDLDQLIQLPRQQILATMKSNPVIAQQMLAILQHLS